MKTKLPSCLTTAILIISLATGAKSYADAVTDWNAIAVQAAVTGTRPVPTIPLDLATVHAAIYDAVQAIEQRFEPYYVDIPGASGSSTAAAAKAAHDVLVNRFPAQAAALDTTYQQYLQSKGLSETDPGVAVGATAAAGIIAKRAADGSFPNPAPPAFIGSTTIGIWRPTAPANAAMLVPWLGNVTPFVATRPAQFRAAPPPALTSVEYAQAFDEVKAIGAANSATRTAAQTDVAQFFAGNPVVMWNQTLRDIATARITDIAESARLFALADMAMADALISCWNDKNRYVLWRPVTAIQNADNDGNAATVSDPAWTSLITNPPYPDYTSGTVNVTTAAMRTLERFFGTDQIPFSATTTNAGPTTQDTRSYQRFSEAVQEAVDARVHSGIHFRFADEAARTSGKEVADWGFANFLRPLGPGPCPASSALANISARGFVQTGDNFIISGFIINWSRRRHRDRARDRSIAGVSGKLEDSVPGIVRQ